VSILSTAELFRRPSRPPDYVAENRALVALAQEMAISPDGILQKLAETALVLCRAHSAGLSLLEDDDQRSNFHWRAIAGQWAPHVNGGTPRNFGPCGTVLDRNVALMCSHPERDFPYFGEVTPLLEEALLIPFYIKEEAVGTIWVVAHDSSRRFDLEDLRVMTNLGEFASAAYQTVLTTNATQRMASTVESSDDAIISKDLDGIITTWNRGAERIFGYTAEQAIGKPGNILIPPDRQDDEPAILDRIRRGERIDHYETTRLCKHGERIDISLTVSPITATRRRVRGRSWQAWRQVASLGDACRLHRRSVQAPSCSRRARCLALHCPGSAAGGDCPRLRDGSLRTVPNPQAVDCQSNRRHAGTHQQHQRRGQVRF
jgi:PAS domain S-box-containing protein